MLRRTIKTSVFLALLLVMIAPVHAQEMIPIGAIFDLTGDTSTVGQHYAEGVTAYFDHLNANGGIAGRPVQLRAVDAGGDVSLAQEAFVRLTSDGVALMLLWGTPETASITSAAARIQVPVLSASYSASFNDPNGSAPYNFVIAPTYGDQVEILLTRMAQLWGGSPADMTVALFYDDSDFGTDPLRAASDAAATLRIGSLIPIRMPSGASDYTAELQQADDYGVTHIIIQTMPEKAAVLARNVASFFGSGVVQIGCLNWCANEQFIAAAGTAAEGALGVQPFAVITADIDAHRTMQQMMNTVTQNDRLPVHFVQGWTTASIAAEAISRTLSSGQSPSGVNVRAALESFDDFETDGLIAPLTFSADDHLGTQASAVYVVSNGMWEASGSVINLR